MPASGQTLAGKYSLVRTLGEGGMGIVYEARHLRLGHRCAIKVLRPEVVGDAETIARFEREARAAAGLASRHVCRVTDVGAREDGAPFLVMEFLEGRDLGSEVESRGPLPIGEAVGYLLQACEALEEAHAKGIVHRDLKPENLFLAREGGGVTVKLLDFGISKVEDDVSVSVTRTQSSIGTPLYMSPEQTRSTKKVDLRTDIWALGVILYELLTADVPFNGDSATAVAVSVAVDRHPSLRARLPDAPPELEAVIDRALQKDPEARFESVRAFARAIAPFAEPGAASRWIRQDPDAPPSRASLPHESEQKIANAATLVDAAPKESHRAMGLPLMGALLGAALAAAAGLLVYVRTTSSPERSASEVAQLDERKAASSAKAISPREEDGNVSHGIVPPTVAQSTAVTGSLAASATAAATAAASAAPLGSSVALPSSTKPGGRDPKPKSSAPSTTPTPTTPKPMPTLPTKI
jgi:serine/threonine protein kinase